MTRKYPYLGKMGSYTIEAQTWLIDDKWQYQRMGMWGNVERRIPVLYTLAQAPAALMNAYTQAVLAIDQAPFRSQLAPLDNDPDFLYYGALFGWGGAPDFQPQVQNLCSTNRALTDQAVNNLIDRIQGNPAKHVPSVAQDMASAFEGLYQRALSAFQAIENAKPPAPPAMVSLAQSQIPQLQTETQQLQTFQQTLQASGGD